MKTLQVLALAAALAGPSSADASEPTPKTTVVPFVLLPTGHFLVAVKLNDKGPYKLIFDTGAPTMLINSRIGKDSGASKGGGGLFGANQSTLKSMEVGSVRAEKVPVVVMDHPTVDAFSKFFKDEHGSIDGIVGFPFFARFRMTVDYQKKELTFTPNGYQPADVTQAMMLAITSAQKDKGKAKIASASGLWGFTADKSASDEEPGVTLGDILKGSASEKAGLKSGDRLLTIDGRWTDSLADTHAAASKIEAGKTVEVTLLRGGKPMALKVSPTKGF